MPLLKRYLAESRNALYALLRQLPDQVFKRESDFVKTLVPALTAALDYSDEETFYDYGRDRYRADVVIANSIESRPWLVLEIKNGALLKPKDWIRQLHGHLDEFNCDKGIVISPYVLIVILKGIEKHFDLKSLTVEQVEEILLDLERPAQPAPDLLDQRGSNHVVKLIEEAEAATTNETKGKTLEALARFLFNSVPSLYCKYSNLRTRSSEIDLVIEYNRSKGALPLFDELGRYCFVECKNWSKPVGAKHIRDFIVKLDKCKVRLGVIFAKNGVTGEESGLNAIIELRDSFQRNGPIILVFSLEDVREITDGMAFSKALDQRFDHLRFDIEA
jgi:hypothetical protein